MQSFTDYMLKEPRRKYFIDNSPNDQDKVVSKPSHSEPLAPWGHGEHVSVTRLRLKLVQHIKSSANREAIRLSLVQLHNWNSTLPEVEGFSKLVSDIKSKVMINSLEKEHVKTFSQPMKFRIFTATVSALVSGLFIGIGASLCAAGNANGLVFLALAVPGIGTSISSILALLQGEKYDT